MGLALAVAFVTQFVFVLVIKTFAEKVPTLNDFAFVAPLISAAAGYAFIRQYIARTPVVIGVMTGILYFGVMWVVLMYGSLIVVGRLYGDWL